MGTPQKIRCEVMQITDHGQHVYTLALKPLRSTPNFLPGQFMHLAIDPYEPGDFWPESRVFSIASKPAQRNMLSITYSVVGNFTTKMEQKIQTGSEVWVKFPYGDFIIQSESDVVLIAGGTGITAFTAFLNGLNPDHKKPISLFYGARSRELLIFKPLVEQKMKTVKTLSAWYFIVKGEPSTKDRVFSGKLNVSTLLPRVPNPMNSNFYLSGPPAMIKNITHDLKSQAIMPERIKIDAWE